MKNFIILCLNFILLTACASKNDVNTIKTEVENLQSTVLDNSLRINSLEKDSPPSMAENNNEIIIPEKEVVYAGSQTPEDDIPQTPPPPSSENENTENNIIAPTAQEELALIEPTTQMQESDVPQSAQPAQPPSQKVQQAPAPTQAAKPTKVAGLNENEAYQAALNLYRTRRYNDSINAFNLFLQTYPSSSYAANAIYWKGESYYAKENFSDAILAFKDVLARFPQSTKSADALFKIALTYSRLGDQPNSALHTTVLLEDWPNSEAAQKAKQLDLQPL